MPRRRSRGMPTQHQLTVGYDMEENSDMLACFCCSTSSCAILIPLIAKKCCHINISTEACMLATCGSLGVAAVLCLYLSSLRSPQRGRRLTTAELYAPLPETMQQPPEDEYLRRAIQAFFDAERQFEEDMRRAMRASIADQQQGRSELTIEEIQTKIELITEILKSMPENIDSKLSSIMLTTIPIIKDPGIFDKPEFLQLLTTNFPEITNPESFKEKLKELYLSFVNLEEENQRSDLILKLQKLIPQTPPPQHTMSDNSSSSSSSSSSS